MVVDAYNPNRRFRSLRPPARQELSGLKAPVDLGPHVVEEKNQLLIIVL